MSVELDVKGLNCPLPVLRVKKRVRDLAAEEPLRILATADEETTMAGARAIAAAAGKIGDRPAIGESIDLQMPHRAQGPWPVVPQFGEAGGALMLNRAAMEAKAASLGLFLYGFSPTLGVGS